LWQQVGFTGLDEKWITCVEYEYLINKPSLVNKKYKIRCALLKCIFVITLWQLIKQFYKIINHARINSFIAPGYCIGFFSFHL
ncbi:hypothetical protein CDAR_590601, partial [Caerostris darwini]